MMTMMMMMTMMIIKNSFFVVFFPFLASNAPADVYCAKFRPKSSDLFKHYAYVRLYIFIRKTPFSYNQRVFKS